MLTILILLAGAFPIPASGVCDGTAALATGETANIQDPAVTKALREEFERRLAALKKDDSKGLLELAQWAEKSNLAMEAKKAYRAVIEADPDNEVARTKLGFVKVNGDWVTKEKAAELEKAKGGDPKKKGLKPPSGPSSGFEKEVQRNSEGDAAESKLLAKILGDAPTVVSSAHFSIRGAVSRELAKDALQACEQALAELNQIFEIADDTPIFGLNKLTFYFAKDEAGVKELVPYIEDRHGKLDPYLKDDIKKNGTGLAASGSNMVALTRAEVDTRSYVLHQLGQVYIDCLTNGVDPWLHEGFAVYTAVRWAGKNTTYCYNVSSYAGNVGQAKKGEDQSFLLICKEIAQDKSDSPMEVLQKKKLNQLDDKDIAKSFSLVKMMIEREPERGLAFLRLYSSHNVARVLKASYKLTPAEFDDHWRASQK
jgi:hypothetical protein